MSSEWIKATSRGSGKSVYINFDKAAFIENGKEGATIWFVPGDRASALDIAETAEQLLNPTGEIEVANDD